jgi:hypothetical protein
MSLQSINIQLPDEIYRRLRQMAAATHQPLEEVIVQTIRGNLPPALDDLQPDMRELVADLEQLGDEAVWAVAPNPDDGQVILLFHPRRQRWNEHFAWDPENINVRGITPHGRATVELFKLNSDWIVQARRLWIIAGVHPPLGDLQSS